MNTYLKKIKNIKNIYGKFNNSELDSVLNVLDSNNNTDYNKKLEDLFCKTFKVKYAISCNSGTSGLHSALAALNLKKDDEVIVPGLTVVMDAYAALHLGATPIFADVDEETYLITAKTIKKKITKKTKAIIVVSLEGLPVDIDPIMKIAKEKNIFVVEDNAQDMLGKYKGRISGTTGDISVWSFENKKHLSGATEGGIISTNNKVLAERIRKFAGIGYKNMTASGGRTSLSISMVQDPNYERFDTVGLNYRMPQIVAAVCYSQLSSARKIVQRRIKVANYFSQAIKKSKILIEQKKPKNTKHSHYTFSARLISSKKNKWKDIYNIYKSKTGHGFYGACVCPHLEPAIINHMKKVGCYNCKKTLSKKCYCTKKGFLPVAEKIQKQIMQFKTNYRNLDEAKKDANTLKNIINKIENQ
jgi:perosamine synthetase